MIELSPRNILIILGIWLLLCAITAIVITAIFRATPQDHDA